MAFYTPRGLKVRIPVPIAFTMLARLGGKFKAKHVLLTTEAVDSIPTVLSHTAAVASFLGHLDPIETVIFTASGAILGQLMIWFGFLVVPGLPTLSHLVSRLGVVLRLAVVSAIAFITRGWSGVGIWVAAYGIATIAGGIVEIAMARASHMESGPESPALTGAEMSFLCAYCYYASDLDLPTSRDNLMPTESEVATQAWMSIALEYAESFPGRIPFEAIQEG